MLRVGLTGGIASGKSTVQDEFIQLGVPVLDADQVARDVVAPGKPALAQIVAAFGADMLLKDGSLDRARMRQRVFAHPDARRQLESITHPAIRQQMTAWLAQQQGPYCILSVAILVEAGMRPLVDRVLVVDADEAVQLRRLCQRDGIDDSLARQMLAAQASRQQRLDAADDVIVNNTDLATLREAASTLHQFYLRLAAEGAPNAAGLRLPMSVI
ncbi:dephospho-CoA kinase [Sinimarinibacterium sp. CAU 1509]|nr:dephospho-CoA kinase [Sinimarinibacterium sp. CAU 1509]